jgi:predicted Zn-dependent protease
LRKAVQVQPGLSQGYAMLGEVLVASGKLDAARAEFDAIAKRDPKNVAAQTMAAMIVHGQGRLKDATTRYEAIVAADRNAVVALNNLAWIYAEEGERLDDALRHAQAAVSRMPDNAEVQDTLGFVYLKKELPTLAIPAFEKSVEKAPENPLYHLHLAQAQDRAGNLAAARQAAQQALKLKPGYAEAEQLLAKTKG